MTLAQGFQHSINSVFCNVGKQIGAKVILDYAKRFGFYSTPPLETPANQRLPSGLYKNNKLWFPKDPATEVDPGRLAFGQERLQVTPLQMLMVGATIANGGVVPRPYIVDRVIGHDGSVVSRTRASTLGRAIKPETAAELNQMMVSVVQAGTGTAAQIPGIQVAGKTGTAETGVNKVYTAWFVSFAPANNPQVAVAVVLEKQLNGFGGAVSAPIAKQIMRKTPVPLKWHLPCNSPVAVSDTLIGTLFDGRYQILRKLGAGGMANVYLAEDQELGRRVAIKILNDRHANDEQFVERFRREAKNAAALSHPNIVSIYDRGEAEGTYYIAMEYLDGRSLKELILSRGDPPIAVVVEYTRQILDALRFAHRHGIVHRDIKPHNVLVDGEGRVKVTDFGIARAGASQMTEAGSIVGTAQYLSPEQARGGDVDQRSDLYSLGVLMYELLTGEVPFSGDTPVEIAMKHLSRTPEPPSTIRPDVPARARHGRHALAREGSRRSLPERRGDGGRPRPCRARRRRRTRDGRDGDADHALAHVGAARGDGGDDDHAAAASGRRGVAAAAAVRLLRPG